MRAAAIATVVCLVVAGGPALSQTASDDKAPPPLAILELGAGKEIKWADVKTPTIAVPLTIENVGKDRLTEIAVDVTPFSGSGRMADALLNGRPGPFVIKSIDPGHRATVTISADLPGAVTYRAHVTLRLAGKTVLSATIEIGRTRAAAPIEVGAFPAQIVELDVFRTPVSAIFNTKINGTGEAVALDAPTVKSTEYKEKIDSKVGVGAPHITVSFDPSASFTVGDTPKPAAVTVANIDTPGRYDVVIAFGGRSYTPATATLTIYARQSVLAALGSILLGVLVSLFLRYYSVIGRPSLLNKQQANRLFRELDEHAVLARDDEHALSLVQDLRRKLSDRWNGLSLAGKLTDSQALDAYAAKIGAFPQWLQLWKRIVRVQPPGVSEPFQVKLLAAEAVLRDRNADLAAVNAQTAILDRMSVDIDAAIKKELRTQMDAFAAQIQRDARFDALRPDLEDVERDLDSARLSAAAQKLDALERRYFVMVADDLAGRLAVEPVGVGATWPATAAAIRDSITRARNAATASDASTAFRSALTLYLRTVIDGLLADIATRIAEGSQYSTRYEGVGKGLKAIGPLMEQGQLVEAWKKLDQAQDLYRGIRSDAGGSNLGPMSTALTALSSLGAAPSAAAEFDITTIALGGSSADAVSRAGAGAALRGWRHLGDIVSTVLILIAALLIGVQTLWFDNPTWGGWPALIAAFLWGLAFDQVSHAGLVALVKRK